MATKTNEYAVVTIGFQQFLLPAADAEMVSRAMMHAINVQQNYDIEHRQWIVHDEPVDVAFRRVRTSQIQFPDVDVAPASGGRALTVRRRIR
jgi:hypothetical protein